MEIDAPSLQRSKSNRSATEVEGCTIPLSNDDGRPMMLAPLDQRRYSKDTSNTITNHFYANEAIPFGWTGKQGFAPLGN